MRIRDVYALTEDKKREQEEWNSIVEKTLHEEQKLSFDSYMMLKDDRKLLLEELIVYVGEQLKQQKGNIILDLGGGMGGSYVTTRIYQ